MDILVSNVIGFNFKILIIKSEFILTMRRLGLS
jgi:hypothetical protein